jgi:hypothetical protein
MSVSKTPLPSAGRFEHYIASGVLGAAVLTLVLLITVFVYRRRSRREPIAVPSFTIVHTPWGRLKNMAWAVATSIVGLLASRVLAIDEHADHIVQALRAVLNYLLG